MQFSSIAELVRAARGDRSQKDFADDVGVKQSSVSRYESGQASPPAPVIEHCMRLVHSRSGDVPPTADELANRIRKDLAGVEVGQVRLALSRLIDTLTAVPPSNLKAR